jgi:hypothetical protein
VPTVGVTTVLEVRTPPAFALHVYDVAPVAVKVELDPEHTAVGVAVTVRVGAEFTVTITVCEEVHPPLSPVTV